MRSRGFHNTIQASPQLAMDFNTKIEKQENVILDFMEKHANESFTPIQIWDRLDKLGYKYLLQSIRRALSNRTETGELEKLTEKVKEKHGADNFKWKFKIRISKT
jgi:hypothetical protein